MDYLKSGIPSLQYKATQVFVRSGKLSALYAEMAQVEEGLAANDGQPRATRTVKRLIEGERPYPGAGLQPPSTTLASSPASGQARFDPEKAEAILSGKHEVTEFNHQAARTFGQAIRQDKELRGEFGGVLPRSEPFDSRQSSGAGSNGAAIVAEHFEQDSAAAQRINSGIPSPFPIPVWQTHSGHL